MGSTTQEVTTENSQENLFHDAGRLYSVTPYQLGMYWHSADERKCTCEEGRVCDRLKSDVELAIDYLTEVTAFPFVPVHNGWT